MKGSGTKICEEGGRGLVLPITDGETKLPNALRGFIYACAMIYFFLGVSIIADVFMNAIEAVTSRKRQVRLKNGRSITIRVWNDTVANLTLMALGSSAPEILLSVLELLKNNMYAGDLGPSTIVGSAAFNLLVIISICIVGVPSGETRKIKEMVVFGITLVFSILAYLWVVIIIVFITPNIVDWWEGVITFMLFPLLVWVSWLADVGQLGNLTRKRQSKVTGGEITEAVQRLCDILGQADEESREAACECLQHNPSLANLNVLGVKKTEELRMKVDEYRKPSEKKSRATRRIEATRVFTGSRKKGGTDSSGKTEIRSWQGAKDAVSAADDECDQSTKIQFTSERSAMSVDLLEMRVVVLRSGDSTFDLSVEYSVHLVANDTEDSTTPSGSTVPVPALGDEAESFSFVFEAGQKQKEIIVSRPNGCEVSKPMDFTIVLRSVTPQVLAASAEVGSIAMMYVVVLPEHSFGKLSFSSEHVTVPGTDGTQQVEVMVRRTGGCSGVVSCAYHTERLTAMPGFDYTEAEGTLEFNEGQTENFVELEILRKGPTESSDTFLVVLTDCEGGSEFDTKDDGGAACSILTVEILARGMATGASGRLLRVLDSKLNFDQIRAGNRECMDQFWAALYCGGGPEEQKEATKIDWVCHIISLPWKLVFSLCPPTSYCGGWACFYISLGLIGVVTAFIGDLAELFGCCLDVPDPITAITFVALGTSMPDLFASQSAAIQDPTADASIVNVTGSNSVNVFLGLGMPWTLGAFYWLAFDQDDEWEHRYPEVAQARNRDPAFVVPAVSLGFTVVVFTAAAMMAVCVLLLRRKKIGAELGGPFNLKVVNSFSMVFLWLCFIILSSWQVLRDDVATDGERWGMILSVVSLCILIVGYSMLVLVRYEAPLAEELAPQAAVIEHMQTKVQTDVNHMQTKVNIDDMSAADNTDGHDGYRFLDIVRDSAAVGEMAVAAPGAVGGAAAQATIGQLPEVTSGTETALPVDPLAGGVDANAFDGAPVQPLPTPSVDPLIAEHDLNCMSQAQLFAHSMELWNRGCVTPVVHLPNKTRDAFLIDQHAVSRSLRGVGSMSTSTVPVSYGVSSSPHTTKCYI